MPTQSPSPNLSIAHKLAKWAAIAGGVVLCALALITLASIIGREDTRLFSWPVIGPFLRTLDLSPIRGDFELVGIGTAIAVCLFMPWAQLHKGHAQVSFIIERFGRRAVLISDFLTDLLLLSVALGLTWRHAVGLMDKWAYQETTFILGLPLWIAYLGLMLGLCTWIVVGALATLHSARLIANRQRPGRSA